MTESKPNKSVETNRRPAPPLNVGRQFGSASCSASNLTTRSGCNRKPSWAGSLSWVVDMRAPLVSIVLFALSVCGCRHTEPVAKIAEYGQPTPGTISILVDGSVERPGRYHVEDGATLASIPKLFGGFRPCETCSFTPSHVIIYPHGNSEQKRRYSLRTSELQTVRLRDGDRVIYGITHF